MGIESCDWAIFFQTLHMYLQVFPPKNSILGHDGLYRVRRWVLAAWLILPNISASLAFVNPNPAYVSQGGFCTLPLRPFWYRLALSWIPRYLIWVFTVVVAIRIYSHVGLEFQVFGAVRDESTRERTTTSATTSAIPRPARLLRSYSAPTNSPGAEKQLLDTDSIGPDDRSVITAPQNIHQALDSYQSSRRGSTATTNWGPFEHGPFGNLDQVAVSPSAAFAQHSRSSPPSRRGSRQHQVGFVMGGDDFAPPAIELEDSRASWSSKHSSKSSGPPPPGGSPVIRPLGIQPDVPKADSAAADGRPKLAPLVLPENAASKAIQQRRNAIQRQLRLLFIYPVSYILLWIMPFVAHAMGYSDYYAQHPVYAVRICSIFAQCFMGTVDFAIFCWREKPWRHVPGSDGSVLGSFMYWRWTSNHGAWHVRTASNAGSAVAQEKATGVRGYLGRLGGSTSRTGSTSMGGTSTPYRAQSASIRSPVSRNFAGMSDRRAMEVDAAHARLRLERAEWDRKLQDGRATLPGHGPRTATTTRKEWWDNRLMTVDDDD